MCKTALSKCLAGFGAAEQVGVGDHLLDQIAFEGVAFEAFDRLASGTG